MIKDLRPAALAFVVLTFLTGIIYPLIVTAFAQLFPNKATGSVIEVNDRAVGSELIGQPFSDPKYFWSRPSATSPQPYNGASSSGSNLGPTNKALHEAVAERLKQFEHKPVPADLVTASASGLDPHISPEAAQFQVSRVAKARGLTEERIQELLDRHIEARTFGLLGEPRVNVLKLNLALDALK